MTSSKSSRKRTGKNYSEETSSFELFYQLTYMSATAAAGISRHRLFDLARLVPVPPARYFDDIYGLVENMRYNYPNACRLVGGRVKSEEMRTFLLRLSDALSSGEPLAPFLAREAKVQSSNYENEYEREMESLKKWGDGYTAVMVSVALVVIINLVSTMIYDIGIPTMVGMIIVACITGFTVAWVISRAAPQEIQSKHWAEGSEEQRRGIKLLKVFGPLSAVAGLALILLGAGWGWTLIVASLFLLPIGIASLIADGKTVKKDEEISPFFRSLGGTATSRGTTLGNALTEIEMDSFPTLEQDINRLDLRLRAFVKPEICWAKFATEAGSLLISQTTGVFYTAIKLGGDPEQAGVLSSKFAMATTMLRAKRRGVAATFSWLTIIMHTVMAALMIFLLEIIKKFIEMLNTAMSVEGQDEAMQAIVGRVMAFSTPPVELLDRMTIGMVLVLIFVNAFAIIANEGAHMIKITFYISLMMFLSGMGFLIVPSLVQMVM